jgi:hypothetical protein
VLIWVRSVSVSISISLAFGLVWSISRVLDSELGLSLSGCSGCVCVVVIVSHSFNTCRVLHILIYIPFQYYSVLSFPDKSWSKFDPACFIGVDGWGVMCL